MIKQYSLIKFKILFALLGFSAVVTEMAVTMDRGTFKASNFFSYFTIESNLIAIAALLLGSIALAQGKKSRHIELFRGAAALYMVTTGIVFSVLLAGLDAELTAVPWDNIVLHYVMPIVLALDWLVDRPKVRLAFKSALIWLVFPLAYVAYSLIRGQMVGWYPYPFLNPASHGYGQVLVVSLGIALLEVALIWALVQVKPPKNTKWWWPFK